jgi:hypothetical protein
VQHGGPAAHRNERRRIVDGLQLRRVFRLAEPDEGDAQPAGCRHLSLGFLPRENPHRPRGAAAPGQIGQCRERPAGTAIIIDQRAERPRPDILAADKAQPVEPLLVGKTNAMGLRVRQGGSPGSINASMPVAAVRRHADEGGRDTDVHLLQRFFLDICNDCTNFRC